MHKLKTIQKTLDLLKQYDYQIAKVARKTGINQRTIKRWFDKQRRVQPSLIENNKKPSKVTYSMKKLVVDYYFEHGKSTSEAAKHFGYPARTTLIEWIKRDRRFDSLKPRRIRKITDSTKTFFLTHITNDEAVANRTSRHLRFFLNEIPP
jgi:transposase-like protein